MKCRLCGGQCEPIIMGHFSCVSCGMLQCLPGPRMAHTTGFSPKSYLADIVTWVGGYKPGGNVLEIGCNDGAFMRKLALAGYRALGVDPVGGAAKIVQPFTAALAHDLEQYDIIFARHVVEHIDDLDDFFQGIDLCLKPDGFVVIELPEVRTLADLWPGEHLSCFGEDHLRFLLTKHGLTIRDSRTVPHSTVYLCERRDWKHSAFIRSCDKLKARLIEATSGKTVILHGAGHRAQAVLEYTGINPDRVMDDRPVTFMGRQAEPYEYVPDALYLIGFDKTPRENEIVIV